ncbi:MAG: hypothetical protein RLZZ366_2010 [Pseudomonadota bacterium]|jgi:general secretion pathway protein N
MRKRYILLFALVLAAALILMFPLRVAVGFMGPMLSARTASGSIWRGTLQDVSFGGVSLGDFRVRLSPLSLLGGKVALQFEGVGDRARRGTLFAKFSGYGADDINARIALPGMFAPLPIDVVELHAASAAFGSKACRTASGRVSITLSGSFAGISLGDALSGQLRCDRGIVTLPLVSPSAMERITLRIAQDGSYAAQLLIRAADADTATKLNAAGFRETTAGHLLEVSGLRI